MITVHAKHLPYKNGHYAKVFKDMLVEGPPTIRVVDYAGSLCAVEGSHRIAVAHAQGLVPKLVILPKDLDETTTFWNNTLAKLPTYAFEHALVLDLNSI